MPRAETGQHIVVSIILRSHPHPFTGPIKTTNIVDLICRSNRLQDLDIDDISDSKHVPQCLCQKKVDISAPFETLGVD